ncbi:hypothetical protein ONS96_000346 [Cadophora gregata f. sp. sojae]|nr:hypothetical protein ONS96_000346 [Cadophora gregata f. sp. sojae]
MAPKKKDDKKKRKKGERGKPDRQQPPPTISSSAGAPPQNTDTPASPLTFPTLILRTSISILYDNMKHQFLHLDVSRNDHATRYKSNDIVGFIRDKPNLAQFRLWNRENEDTLINNDVNGNIPYGLHQVTMPYYEIPINKSDGESKTCTSELKSSATGSIWFDGPTGPVFLPTGVRPSDSYLGAAFVDLDQPDLAAWFSADINPDDGHPYSDRVPYGVPFRPRLASVDYPQNGVWVPDRRIGYSVCPNKDIIIYGGSTLTQADITHEMWMNFHHYFVLIPSIGCRRTALLPVLQEPQEVRRQQRLAAHDPLKHQHKDKEVPFVGQLQPFQPPGVQNTFNQAALALEDIMDRKENEGFVVSLGSTRDRIMSQVPARGYDSTKPSWEIFPQAMTSASMFHGAYVSMVSDAERNHAVLTDVLKGFDTALNAIATNQSDGFSTKIFDIRDQLNETLSVSRAVTAECTRSLEGVTNPVTILDSLPDTIINATHRSVISLVSDVMCTIGPETVGTVPPAVPSRRALTPELDISAQDYNVPVPQKDPYPAPYSASDLTIPTSAVLFNTLSSPPVLQQAVPSRLPAENENFDEETTSWFHGRLSQRGPIFQSDLKKDGNASQTLLSQVPVYTPGSALSPPDLQTKATHTQVIPSSSASTITPQGKRYTKRSRDKTPDAPATDTTSPGALSANTTAPKRPRYTNFVFNPVQALRAQNRAPNHNWRVTDLVDNRTPFLRDLCKVFGVKRAGTIAQMTYAIEDKVNQEGWGNTLNGRLFGTMVPSSDPCQYPRAKPMVPHSQQQVNPPPPGFIPNTVPPAALLPPTPVVPSSSTAPVLLTSQPLLALTSIVQVVLPSVPTKNTLAKALMVPSPMTPQLGAI